MLTLAVVALVVVCGAGAAVVAGELRRARRERQQQQLLGIFAPAAARVARDPRELLVWFPLAEAARRLFPHAFRELDAALDASFPFSAAQVQEAHARWTAEWLSWERNHDFDYKLKAAEAERELERSGEVGTAIGRARLAGIEREQLARYQERYAEYVRASKALEGLSAPSTQRTDARGTG